MVEPSAARALEHGTAAAAGHGAVAAAAHGGERSGLGLLDKLLQKVGRGQGEMEML